MKPQINLSLNARTPSAMLRVQTSVNAFDRAYRIQELSYIQNPPSIPTTAVRSTVSCRPFTAVLQKSKQNNKNLAMLTTCNQYRETSGRQRDERLNKGSGSRKGGGLRVPIPAYVQGVRMDFTGESGETCINNNQTERLTMTPLEINLLLHVYTTPCLPDNHDLPITQQTLLYFIDNGLIVKTEDDLYETTEKGVAHVAQLCSLSLPETAWIDGNGNIIKY